MPTYRPRSRTSLIVVHSSHTGPDIVNAEGYLRVTGRVMGLLEIGYHYLVEKSGTVRQCRPPEVLGSHTPGMNGASIGICFAGGHDEQGRPDPLAFTAEQMRAGRRLVDDLLLRFGLLTVAGHTELQHYRDRDIKCPEFPMGDFRSHLTQPHKGPAPRAQKQEQKPCYPAGRRQSLHVTPMPAGAGLPEDWARSHQPHRLDPPGRGLGDQEDC